MDAQKQDETTDAEKQDEAEIPTALTKKISKGKNVKYYRDLQAAQKGIKDALRLLKVNKIAEVITALTKVYNVLYDYSADWISLPEPTEERKPKEGTQFSMVMVVSVKMCESLSSELDFQKIENTCTGCVTLI